MIMLDTDVAIDIRRGYAPAVNWITTNQTEQIAMCGIVVMELVQGCKSKAEQKQLLTWVDPFLIYWPTEGDCNRAFHDFTRAWLTHSLGLLDALIGQCAVGLAVSFATHNVKHYQQVSGLSLVQPYAKK